MEPIVGLHKKMEHHRQEIERIKHSILHLENEKKTTYLKNHMGMWFLNGDSYIKPLKIQGHIIIALSIGQYEDMPFMEIEKVDIQNLFVARPLGHKIPKEVLIIQRDIQMYITGHKGQPECNNNVAKPSLK